MDNWDLDEYRANDLYIIWYTTIFRYYYLLLYNNVQTLDFVYIIYMNSFRHRSSDGGRDTYCDA